MTTTYEREGLTWIDLESPEKAELDAIAQKYNLHPLVVEELAQRSDRPKVDLYDQAMYLILHFPTLRHESYSSEEIDFVIGKDFLITVHYQPVDALREVAGIFEINAVLQKNKNAGHAGFLFFTIIQKLYHSLEERMESVSHDLETAKNRIFRGEERAMVERLSSLNRTLLDFRISLKSHGNIWNSFENVGGEFFDKKFSYYMAAITGEYTKTWNMLEGNKEILSDLRETNDSLLTTKMNETMVHLTMMAFVVFPLTLIAAIFAMRTEDIPLIGTEGDFMKVIAIMAIVTVFIFVFFKYRKWL